MEEELTFVIKLRLTKEGQLAMAKDNYHTAKQMVQQLKDGLSRDTVNFKGVLVEVSTRKV